MSNVLVYSGPGVSSSALAHTLRTLRRLLPTYDVQCISAASLATDPWTQTCALFVLPGGRDLPYVDHLSRSHVTSAHAKPTRADETIRHYVEDVGGSYLGICAGAYYASSYCEFERGDSTFEVVGPRPALQFYPGTKRGTVYPGFVYESDKGARLVDVSLDSSDPWKCHYNGGGAFIDAEGEGSKDVEILARYHAQKGIREGYAQQAAAILCHKGKGRALLYGIHPEFPIDGPINEEIGQSEIGTDDVQMTDIVYEEMEIKRLEVFASHLERLGLVVKRPPATTSNKDTEGAEAGPPKLTPIILAGSSRSQVSEVLRNLEKIASRGGEVAALDNVDIGLVRLTVSDSNDTFHVAPATSAGSLFPALARADYAKYMAPVVAPSSDEARAGDDAAPLVDVDRDKVPKYIVCLEDGVSIDKRFTPHFDIQDFFDYLRQSRSRIAELEKRKQTSLLSGPRWEEEDGSDIMLCDAIWYSQVVTSTQTMLDKNYKLITHLPNGLTSFATHQVSGRGRGKNAWISPLGCLQFSTLLHIDPSKLYRSGIGGVVFVQYLAGLAIVEAVRKGLGPEYETIGRRMRIKWPNDVYADVGSATEEATEGGAGKQKERKGTFTFMGRRYAKMAGVLVNSQFAGKELALVVGCGINTLNPRPTTSLSDLIATHNVSHPIEKQVSIVSQERFAGAILTTLERFWNEFIAAGGHFGPFVERYRDVWLHSDQTTMLQDTNPPTPVRIVGISTDHGTLRAVPLDRQVYSDSPGAWGGNTARAGGDFIDLQPDGNSFDMLQNLIRKKE